MICCMITALICRGQVVRERVILIGTDKYIHFAASMSFTPGAIQVLDAWNVRQPEIKGIALVMGVGAIKEAAFDKRFNPNDLIANAAGCLAGYCLNRLWMKKEARCRARRNTRHMPYFRSR